MTRLATVLIASTAIASPLAAGQGAAGHERQHSGTSIHGTSPHAAAVMGFDQSKAVHKFSLFEDGGAIQISVTDPADTTNRDAIRAHLPHIAARFGQGHFESPQRVHDTTTVPGTAALSEHKDKITYTYVETSAGGRVDIVTTDPAALAAVHEFLKFQIRAHATTDSLTVRKRAGSSGRLHR
jgi:hypothetical protein